MRKTISLAILATLVCGTLMAQPSRMLSDYGWKPKSSVDIPYRVENPDSPDANIVVAQYLGSTPTALFDPTNGYVVTGPLDVTFGGPFSLAVKFTAAVNSHAKTLSAAIGYIEGTKKVRLGIYTDNAGLVGTLIQDAVTTAIPNFGACCQLTKVNLSGLGAALTAGTSYWLVASYDTTAQDFGGAWAWVPGDVGANDGTGWVNQGGYTLLPAFQIKGTNP